MEPLSADLFKVVLSFNQFLVHYLLLPRKKQEITYRRATLTIHQIYLSNASNSNKYTSVCMGRVRDVKP